ncbi:MAG: hypothetical protein JWR44_450 [Hymenobacter sp.]|nr:hypothetical protein [Hymenobacter sp.]
MFRTELPIAPATDQLSRTARVLTMGSCFAESIGSRLAANKVETLVNPFGTVFQPLALGRLLRAAAGEEIDWQQHLVEARGRWQSYDLHGSIGAESPVELLQTIQELVRRTGEFLRTADVALLTLGTAWAYRLRETGELVSNCHKQPADLFVRELLTPDEIINSLAETHAYLRRINPKLRFVLTVSPVRHLKETLPLNNVSKSVLRLATHIVSDLLPGVAYFPAYELLVDDLRDYRFYASDMLHPSEVAEDYIWDKFARTYFDVDFGRFRKEWTGVRQSLEHRPLHAGAPEHRQFLESTLQKLEQLSLRKVGVEAELQTVRTQLAALPIPRVPEPKPEIEDDEERIDIGQDGNSVAAGTAFQSAAAVPVADSRPPRLSPEEFRSQRSARNERGRRDGRGKGQPVQPSENEQFQAATLLPAPPEVPCVATQLPQAAADAATTALIAEVMSTSPLPDQAMGVAGEEPVKKKKRRSRGGAKRTARKNALRMADEMTPENNADAGNAPALISPDAVPAAGETPERTKVSVITKSVPVKRGGRRNEGGRLPRAELFASAAEEAPDAQDAEMPALATALPAEAIPTGLVSPTAEEPAKATGTRNNRNRNRKGARPEGVALGAEPTPPTVTDAAATPVIGTAEELSGVPVLPNRPARNRAGRDKQRNVTLAAAVPAPAEITASAPIPEATTPAVAPAPAPARKSNRAKRVISGARTEKPAVDTPVIPVPDATMPRTQVAAGRMMGSSASLVEPTAQKPAAVPKKAASTKKPAAKAAPKAKAEKPAPASPPPPPVVVAPPKPKAAAKPKPAAKAKAAPAKAKAAPAKAKAAAPKTPKKPGKPA